MTARTVVRRYEVRVRRPISRALAAELGPLARRDEPPITVLIGALEQRRLYALLEQLLTDWSLLVLDVRVAGAAAPAPVISSPRGPAPHVLEFAGSIATEALVDQFGVAIADRGDRTVLAGALTPACSPGCSRPRAASGSICSPCAA